MARVFRVIAGAGRLAPVELNEESATGASQRDRILLAGFDGEALPALVTDPELEQVEAGATRWQLRCREGTFHFTAAVVERITGCAGAWEPLHRSFALGAGRRRLAVVLLGLLRLPGAAWLLQRWQARRG